MLHRAHRLAGVAPELQHLTVEDMDTDMSHAAAGGGPSPRRQRVRLRSIAANTLVQFVAPGIRFGLGLILVAVLGRYLGLAGFGQLSLVFAYVAFFSGIFNDWGLGTIVLRQISRFPERRMGLVTSGAVLQLVIAAATYVVLLLGLLVVDYPAETKAGAAVLGLSVLLSPVDILSLPFQADLRLTRLLAPAALGPVFQFTATVAVVALGGSLLLIVAAALAGQVLQYAWVAALAAGRHGLAPPSRRTWPGYLRESLPLAGSTVVTTVYQQTPLLALSLVGLPAVGLFGAASRIPQQVGLVSGAVRVSTFPLFSRLWVEDRPRFRALFARLIALTVLLTVPMVVFGVLLSEQLMVAIFGEAFHQAGVPFAVLLIAFGLLQPAIVAGEALIAAGAQRLNLLVQLLGLPSLLTLLWFLIPRAGASGAALALLVGYGFITIAIVIIASVRFSSFASLRSGVAGLAVGASMSSFAIVPEHGSLPVATVAALLAFLLMIAVQPRAAQDLVALLGMLWGDREIVPSTSMARRGP